MRWAYGVTTVPERRDDYLRCTLASLRAGGFDEPRLFVDGSDDHLGWSRWSHESGIGALPVTCRMPRIGLVGNWVLALWELHLRNPRADRYAVFQDDLMCVRNLRPFLERSPWPGRGYLNLFTFSQANYLALRGKPPGWHEGALLNPPDRNPGLFQCGRGALGLVFDRDALLALLSARPLAEKPWAADPKIAGRRLDGGVVNAMNLAGYREYVHNPSLLQHVGQQSSIGNTWNWERDKVGKVDHASGVSWSFPGEDFDALGLLPAAPG